MQRFFLLLALAGLLITGTGLAAAERIPSAPARHFNDYAGVISAPTATQLNTELEQYERASSNQIIVVIYPRMESDSSVEDYTVRVAQAWGAGQKDRNNGAVLFAFMQERKLYLQVGYGLEARIPDALAKRIIENEIVPRFKQGDRDGGMRAAVTALIAATKGEYKGTGRLARKAPPPATAKDFRVVAVMIGIFLIGGLISLYVLSKFLRQMAKNPTMLLNPRRRGGFLGNSWNVGGNWGGGSSHRGGSFGGGGFSGGGGSFGGGGAGGSW